MLNNYPFDGLKITFAAISEGLPASINENSKNFYLVYTASGKGLINTNGRLIKTEEGKSYLLAEKAQLSSTSSSLHSVYMLSWPKEGEGLSPLLSGPLAHQVPAKLVPLWGDLRRTEKETSVSGRCRFQAQLWNILSMLTDEAEVDRIEEAMEMMRSHLSQPFTVPELAAKANMSPVSFSRAFRKRTGMTPKEFLNEERMKAAKELMLQKKGITAKEVALFIGMQDEFYFSRFFKRREGMPPSFYMRRAKDRIAVVSQLFLQDHLLSLGIQPVAAPSYPSVYPASRGVPSYLEKELQGTLLLNAEKAFQPDDILLTQPDCIIKTPLHNRQLQTVLFSQQQRVQHVQLKTEWFQYLREIASMVGQEGQAECIEKEISCLECKVKDELCPLTKKGRWAVIWIRPDEIRLYGQGGHAFMDLLFNSLEFQPHPDLPSEGYKIVTLNEVAALNPDKLLILWSHEKDVWRAAHMPDWKKIRAVQTGEVYYPQSHDWDPWGPLGRKYMLEHFAAGMTKAKLKA
jgi:AraC family transcriptional regulator, transcriptional activator for feuABC-ybbA operon